MAISRKKIAETIDALRIVAEERQTEKFLGQMKLEHETRPDLYPAEISRSSFFRLLRMGEDIDALYHQQSAALKAVERYLTLRNQLHEIDLSTLSRLQFVENYFRTSSSKYTSIDVSSLCGNYDMYRRFWRARDKNLFMRSRVKITRFKKGYFVFYERQNWPKDDYWPQDHYVETSRGFLFPSGQSIVTVCEALGEQNTKFMSMSDFEPPLEIASKIDSFSGSAIASSDVPPHLGYGFYCERSDNVSNICELVDIRDINQSILRRILFNENYVIEKYADFEKKVKSVQNFSSSNRGK